MTALLRRLALAASIACLGAAAHASPIEDCRAQNRGLMKELQNMLVKGRQDYTLVGTQRENWEAKYNEATAQGGTPSLEQCKARTKKLNDLKAATPSMLVKPDPQVVACRNANRDRITRLVNGIKSYNSALTQAESTMLGKHANGIETYNRDAEKRGYTVADCKGVSDRIQNYETDAGKICYRPLGSKEFVCIRPA